MIPVDLSNMYQILIIYNLLLISPKSNAHIHVTRSFKWYL
jgi:hypothetical protein